MDSKIEVQIAKFLSSYGVCSRKEAEKLVFEGKVKINGKTLTSLN